MLECFAHKATLNNSAIILSKPHNSIHTKYYSHLCTYILAADIQNITVVHANCPHTIINLIQSASLAYLNFFKFS